MFKTKKCSVILACLMAGALAGCDTQLPDGAQGGDEVSSESAGETFAGLLDYTFAGEALPDVTLSDPAGITLDLNATRGKPVLLNLWATWCAPCIVELPMLDQLASELGEDVRVVTVSEDINGAQAVLPFFEANNFVHLPRWMDANNDLAAAFGGGTVLPLTVMYDGDGIEVWRVIGAYDWSSKEVRAMIGEVVAAEG